MNKNYSEEIEEIMDEIEKIENKNWEIHKKIKSKKQEYMDVVEIEDLDEFFEKALAIKKELKDLEDEYEKTVDINDELFKDLDTVEIQRFVQEELTNPSKELLRFIAEKADEEIGLSSGGLVGFDEDRLSFYMDMIEGSIDNNLGFALSHNEYIKESEEYIDILEKTIDALNETVDLQQEQINTLEKIVKIKDLTIEQLLE